MRRKTKRRESKDLNINISSLMDILTILLLFLILNFESQENKVNPPENIELPASKSELNVKLAVKVTVSVDDIRVEDHIVTKLSSGKFRSRDLDSANLVAPLLRELRRQKAKLQSGSRRSTADEEEKDIVYFEAGKGVKFELVDRVLNTAATAGFTKFRLAVHRQG